MGSKIHTIKENRVVIPEPTRIIQDSGAFCDSPSSRLTNAEAIVRQIAHGDKYNYSDMIEMRSTYDLLIDEKWENGKRSKIRWTESEAWDAVNVTVEAAEYYNTHRYGVGLVLSCQGVTANQYLKCAERVVGMYREGDAIGLGGWCILGKQRRRLGRSFRETIVNVIPFLGDEGVKRVHIWGVIYPVGLGELLWMCNKHGITLSTDSAGPQFKPVMGSWGYGDWTDVAYRRKPTNVRSADRKKHLDITRGWLNGLENTQYYRDPSQFL